MGGEIDFTGVVGWVASVMYLLAVIVFIWNQGDSSEEE